jgi:hypothetical protein
LDHNSTGSVYGGFGSVEASLRLEPVSGTTDDAPLIDFHLGPSDVVPLFQHSRLKFHRYTLFVLNIVLIVVFISVCCIVLSSFCV